MPIFVLRSETYNSSHTVATKDAANHLQRLDLGDLVDLSRRGLVVHPVTQQDPQHFAVHVSYCGEFCRIAPRKLGCNGLEKLISAIDHIERKKTYYLLSLQIMF